MLNWLPTSLSAQWPVVGLGLICLLQYVHRTSIRAARAAEQDRVRLELHGLEHEMLSLSRDRTITRLENQILREILGQADFTKSLATLLRRFVPSANDGFAVLIRLDREAPSVFCSRGLTQESIDGFQVDEETIVRLRNGDQVTLEGLALAKSHLFSSLDPADRRKARQLFVVGIGESRDLFAALVSTHLLPPAADRVEQFELSQRLMTCIAGNLRQTLALEDQTNQLRFTREMLELKSIADSQTEQPLRMFERFLSRLAELVGCERVSLSLVATEIPCGFRVLARAGLPLQPGVEACWQRHEESLTQRGIAVGHSLAYSPEALKQQGIDTLIGSALSQPLKRQKRVAGLLCFTRRSVTHFSFDNQQLIAWAAETLLETIQRSLAFVEIGRQAKEDSLTGLANRRTFDTQLARELAVVEQTNGRECSLLMCDLDRFKSINDTHGHPAGDEVLRETARTLRDQIGRVRATDRIVLARYGGEEIAILLPGIGLAGATRIAESIREAVSRQEFRFSGQPQKVTISVGVATFDPQNPLPEHLLQSADEALYLAKTTGRNRVCSAPAATGPTTAPASSRGPKGGAELVEHCVELKH